MNHKTRISYIRRLFLYILSNIERLVMVTKKKLLVDSNIRNIKIKKDINNNILVSLYIDSRKEVMSFQEFISSGLWTSLSNEDKDDIILNLSINIKNYKPYKFQILDNKLINVYLNNEVFLEELTKTELLKKRDIIECADNTTYQNILAIKDKVFSKIV